MDSRFIRWLIVLVALNLAAGAHATAQECESIEWRSPTPFGYSLDDVVFGNGVFLAPAGRYQGNHVAISSDGASWTLHRVVTSARSDPGLWKSVLDGSQFIVTAGYRQLYTSPDGIDMDRHQVGGTLRRRQRCRHKGPRTVVSDRAGVLLTNH